MSTGTFVAGEVVICRCGEETDEEFRKRTRTMTQTLRFIVINVLTELDIPPEDRERIRHTVDDVCFHSLARIQLFGSPLCLAVFAHDLLSCFLGIPMAQFRRAYEVAIPRFVAYSKGRFSIYSANNHPEELTWLKTLPDERIHLSNLVYVHVTRRDREAYLDMVRQSLIPWRSLPRLAFQALRGLDESLCALDSKALLDAVARLRRRRPDLEMPAEFRCPISQEPIRIAWRTPCNHIFEGDEIAKWVASQTQHERPELNHHWACPLCRAPLWTGALRRDTHFEETIAWWSRRKR